MVTKRNISLMALILLVVFWISIVSVPGSDIEGCLSGCATRIDAKPTSLSVLSLNMYHGFPRFVDFNERMDLILDEIQRINPDVLFLQEVPWRPGFGSIAETIAKTVGLNHAYARANGNKWAILFEEGEAIFSRYGLKDVQAIEIKPKAGVFENRIVLHAVIDSPWGAIDLFNTHLTHGDDAINRKQNSALSTIIAKRTNFLVIVGGDFNAIPESIQIESHPVNWIDTSLWNKPDDQEFTCCIQDIRAADSSGLNKRVDYLYLIPGEGIEGLGNFQTRRAFERPFRVDDGWLWASDHAGLLTEIELSDR